MRTLLGNRTQPPQPFASHKDGPDFSTGASQLQAASTFTRITAKIELGKDYVLYIRGHGEGLRWDSGQPLAHVGGSTWVWSVCHATEVIEFHLLLDDVIWGRGNNLVLEPGRVVELRPDFEWPEIPHVVPPAS
jgi:hypothetical protein